MKPILKEDKNTFKIMLSFLETDQPLFPSMQEFCNKYDIKVDEMREALKKDRDFWITKFKVMGFI